MKNRSPTKNLSPMSSENKKEVSNSLIALDAIEKDKLVTWCFNQKPKSNITKEINNLVKQFNIKNAKKDERIKTNKRDPKRK